MLYIAKFNVMIVSVCIPCFIVYIKVQLWTGIALIFCFYLCKPEGRTPQHTNTDNACSDTVVWFFFLVWVSVSRDLINLALQYTMLPWLFPFVFLFPLCGMGSAIKASFILKPVICYCFMPILAFYYCQMCEMF